MQEIPVGKFNRVINHGPVLLVSCRGEDGRDNVLTVAWSMPASRKPPLVALAVGSRHFSYPLIKSSNELVLNIPSADMVDQVWACGSKSGKAVDKFEELEIERAPSVKVAAPRVSGCPAYLECRLFDEYVTPSGTSLLLAEVIHAETEDGVLDEGYVLNEEKGRMLHHLGSDLFMTPGPRVKPSGR